MYVVDYVSTHLPNVIKQKILSTFYTSHGDETPREMELQPEIIEGILIRAFLQVDYDLLNNDSKPNVVGGTTATIAVVTSSNIVVANLGDSPSFTFSKINSHKIIDQTENHIPNNPKECQRVVESGGKVSIEVDGSKRVDGFLSITRAFGHRNYKNNTPPNQQIISSFPQTYIWNRTSDMMLVLCSDSFTEAICSEPKIMIRNILENEDILKAISKCVEECKYDIKSAVNMLCDRQIEKFNFPRQGYAGDNTSIILIDFSALSTSSSSPISSDDDSAVTDQSFSADKASFSTLYARCVAEGGLPVKDLSGIKRTSNCLINDIPSNDSYEDEEGSRARSFSRSDASSSRTTPIGTPSRSRNSSFTSDFTNILQVTAPGNNSANSSWADVASNPQSPLEGTVFVNLNVGLSLSPSTNSCISMLHNGITNSTNADAIAASDTSTASQSIFDLSNT